MKKIVLAFLIQKGAQNYDISYTWDNIDGPPEFKVCSCLFCNNFKSKHMHKM